ncbi:MAG: thymidine kinase [Candidatus Pacebacteria bacterium]|nr:thymidine kinase [Candidatus Paceibacterota bacterium]
MRGKLEVIVGCMFSGKTEELIRRLHRLQFARQEYLLFKPSFDTRYGEKIVATHYGREMQAFLLTPGEETVEKVIEIAREQAFKKALVIAFDEGQFYSPRFVELCKNLVNLGKRVIVAGLDLNFRGEPFGPMPQLLALADEVAKLQAVCVKCGKPATRTQRLINGEPVTLGPEIQVGGAETYEARCLDCWVAPSD